MDGEGGGGGGEGGEGGGELVTMRLRTIVLVD